PLEAGGEEERAGVDEIDRERREQEPGKPVVPPGPLVGEEDVIANREPAAPKARAPIQEGRAKDAGAPHRRADADRLSLDRGLLRARRSLARPARPRQIALAETGPEKENSKDTGPRHRRRPGYDTIWTATSVKAIHACYGPGGRSAWQKR